MKNYTENHQKSRNFNIFLLTSSIFRGLRSVIFKNFFSLYQKYIREFAFKKLLRYLFFSKNYSIFPRGGLWSPPPSPGYDNFLPPPPTPRIGLAKQRGFSVFTIFASHLCVNNSPKRNLNNRHLVISGLASQHQHWHCIFFFFLPHDAFLLKK